MVSVSTAQIPAEQTQELEKLYNFRGKEEVLEFLEQNAFLVPLLFEAYGKVKIYFPESELFLEVHYDPEEPVVNLVLIITTDLEVDEAYEREKQMDEDWWMEAVDRAQNVFFYNVR